MSDKKYSAGDLVVYDGVVYKIHTEWNDGEKFDLTRIHPKSNEINVRGARPEHIKHWDGKAR